MVRSRVCPRSNLLHEVQSRVGFQLLLEPLHGRDPSLFNQFRPGFDLGIGLGGRPIGGRHSRQFGRVDGDPPFVDGTFSFQTCWHFDLGQEKSHTLWTSAGLKVYLHVRFQCPILRSNAILDMNTPALIIYKDGNVFFISIATNFGELCFVRCHVVRQPFWPTGLTDCLTS